MVKLIKLIGFVAVFATLGFGCIHTEDHNENLKTPTVQNLGAFNDEVYVWENWSVTTNRVQTVK